MLTSDNIAKRITASRSEFAFAFLQAQFNLGISVLNRKEFEAVSNSSSDKQAFKQAFDYAKSTKGLTEEIIRVICNSGYDDGTLLLLVTETQGTKGDFLQALSNPASGFIAPAVLAYGTLKGLQWTGKVMIDGHFKGSGILIGPKRFLTAWHVIEEMFQPTPFTDPPEYTPKQVLPSLQVMFDHYVDFINGSSKPKKTITVDAASDWLESFSNSHYTEFTSLPDPLNVLKKFSDYAVIRLEDVVDEQRQHALLDKRAVVPGSQGKIMLFQYPSGAPMQMDIDEVVDIDPPIGDIRFLHQSNATPGSSGGPCFDKDFFLVGIHQGEWPHKINGRITNRGIPIRNIIVDMEQKKAATASGTPTMLGPNPEEYLVWYLDKKTYDPIIGIDDFQIAMLENAQSGQGYVIILQGEKGTGKSFFIQTIFALLKDATHCKVELPGEIIAKMNALDLAKLICSGVGGNRTDWVDFAAYNATNATWLRDEVLAKTLETLEEKRTSRIVVLCFKNLNLHKLDGQNSQDFLLLLSEAVLQNPWLHIVLDGSKSPLPASLAAATQFYTTKPKSEKEIHQYIDRFMKELKVNANPMMIVGFAKFLYDQYQAAMAKDETTAMTVLSDQCKLMLGNFINQIPK